MFAEYVREHPSTFPRNLLASNKHAMSSCGLGSHAFRSQQSESRGELICPPQTWHALMVSNFLFSSSLSLFLTPVTTNLHSGAEFCKMPLNLSHVAGVPIMAGTICSVSTHHRFRTGLFYDWEMSYRSRSLECSQAPSFFSWFGLKRNDTSPNN